MSKKIVIASLWLGLAAVIYFLAARPSILDKPASPTHSVSPAAIPTTSLEQEICAEIEGKNEECKRIHLFDADSHLVFAEDSSGIIPVLTNKEFTEFKKFIYPGLNFQEFREEKEETGPIVWCVKNNVQKDFSLVYGFARDEAKTIVINSEGGIQPNRFFIRDDLAGKSGSSGTGALWVWYAAFRKDKIKLPLQVTVYDAKGEIINGNEEE
ncbi:hypothetical protein [Peribacillus deserti]|uniref:Uncharacterized protein n=1 Tax=Peribacillus deserti TaxID=673318 RepID=A0A2N5MBS0_9BACI|nr:hypothetical protein [Peribacillus deserti]PLT31812.1 hypothetical protein CUU66_01245 [Peribacillus deserti]